jgi:LmbE family N-acetylglucosaminyl deacetylase
VALLFLLGTVFLDRKAAPPGAQTIRNREMSTLEELRKEFQPGGLVIFVDEDRDPDYRSVVKILDRDENSVFLWWPLDGYCEEGWYLLDWLIIRSIEVSS